MSQPKKSLKECIHKHVKLLYNQNCKMKAILCEQDCPVDPSHDLFDHNTIEIFKIKDAYQKIQKNALE